MSETGDVFFVVGPTGSGKSTVAAALARSWNGEIVNGDAFQVYRGLCLISAAPEPSELKAAPHHLYGILAPDEPFDAVSYRERALVCLGEIRSRGRLPIVVGGSGLYIKALTHGFDDVPPGDPELRRVLESPGDADLVEWLCRLDPEGAVAMNLSNRRYVMRALEITLLTGRPASEIKGGQSARDPAKHLGVCLVRKREELYRRIDARVIAMVEAGVVEEIRSLGSKLSLTAAKAIGVREIQAFLRGEILLDEAVTAIQMASRRYAKRQMTWFRREEKVFQTVCLTSEDDASSVVARIEALFPERAPGHV